MHFLRFLCVSKIVDFQKFCLASFSKKGQTVENTQIYKVTINVTVLKWLLDEFNVLFRPDFLYKRLRVTTSYKLVQKIYAFTILYIIIY